MTPIMTTPQPDLERDVIVQHVTSDAGGVADRWVVFLGRSKRTEIDSQSGALLFARLLADLQQRRVWVCHDPDGDLNPLDPSQLTGCSCC